MIFLERKIVIHIHDIELLYLIILERKCVISLHEKRNIVFDLLKGDKIFASMKSMPMILDYLKRIMNGKYIIIVLRILKRNKNLHAEKNNHYVRPWKRNK